MKKEELIEWLEYFYAKDVKEMPNHGTATDAYKEIWAILKKPQVTKEWIEEKAKILMEHEILWDFAQCKDFIRSLVEEIKRVA